MIVQAIQKAVSGTDLTEAEMTAAMLEIMEGKTNPVRIATLLTALRMKGETIPEITGAAKVMRQKALTIPVSIREDLVDVVGTGGDSSNTFNISTAAAFVVCGAGLRVAKHGNRSVSSRCGSADVIEKLGVNIALGPESVGRTIDELGIGFLFAQTLHLAMKHAAPVRKEMGIRSIFNILGPLTNPADAEIQLVGVYDRKLVEPIAGVLQQLGRKRALVVHGRDGLDEITIGAETDICELEGGKLKSYTIQPEDFGYSRFGLDSLKGGGPAENAAIIKALLQGSRGPHRDIVCLNAGAAIMAAARADNIKDGIRLAQESIDSGSANRKLELLCEMTQGLA
ncbi:MAG: anthranilate phosphoribosyltransferase [Deltaproteobacteria bacterium]|nr:anthranilate phosphoribosyltransferase [Deltaproteobacteria bacterium]